MPGVRRVAKFVRDMPHGVSSVLRAGVHGKGCGKGSFLNFALKTLGHNSKQIEVVSYPNIVCEVVIERREGSAVFHPQSSPLYMWVCV